MYREEEEKINTEKYVEVVSKEWNTERTFAVKIHFVNP